MTISKTSSTKKTETSGVPARDKNQTKTSLANPSSSMAEASFLFMLGGLCAELAEASTNTRGTPNLAISQQKNFVQSLSRMSMGSAELKEITALAKDLVNSLAQNLSSFEQRSVDKEEKSTAESQDSSKSTDVSNENSKVDQQDVAAESEATAESEAAADTQSNEGEGGGSYVPKNTSMTWATGRVDPGKSVLENSVSANLNNSLSNRGSSGASTGSGSTYNANCGLNLLEFKPVGSKPLPPPKPFGIV